MRTRYLPWFTLPALPARLPRFSKLLLDIASQLLAGMNCRFCTSFWMRQFLLHFLVLTFCADSRGPPPCSFFVSVFADTIIEHKNSRAFWKPEILFYEMLTVPVFFFFHDTQVGTSRVSAGYQEKKDKNEWRSFTPCNILQTRCSKIKRPPVSSLGDPSFQECPSPGALPYTKLILSWLKWTTELVLQIFCAHYGRHLPLSQVCHAMLPGLVLYLLKSEPEMDHTTNLLNHAT